MSRGLGDVYKRQNMQTAKPLLEVGADVLVAGSFVFRSPDPLKTIRELKEL